MAHTAFQRLRRFLREEKASLVAEALLILPALVWWYVGSLVYFHGYEARNVNMKAAYTIADMVSREDGAIGPAYVNGLDNIFEYLTAGNGGDGKVRVTLVKCESDCPRGDPGRVLKVAWSYGTDGLAPLTDANISDYAKWIPLTAQGDYVTLLETMVDYTPAWTTVGLDVDSFINRVVTRPRFVPQIPWDDSL